jgi:ribonucleoside-triphosphate reductase (formate)
MIDPRAEVITRRTYCRPKNELDGTDFESWHEVVARVITHQAWLWERAKGASLNNKQIAELGELRDLLLTRKGLVAGRTLWLGGTDISRNRESSMFNCSFEMVKTVYDFVDFFWLLLQGCGVGSKPITGCLTGFAQPIKSIKIIRSTQTNQYKGGDEHNTEIWDPDNKVWTIRVGDSAEGWARSFGKLLSGKYPADKLVLDYSNIRAPGARIKGYGWICVGDGPLAYAYEEIARILNRKAGCLLSKLDILDICNLLGTVLSTRRSAQILLADYGSREWEEFATAKKDCFTNGLWWRSQSNNSLVFKEKPSRSELRRIFDMMIDSGGSEPGFINAESARKRAPWFEGMNPCAEILLADKSFCNLCELDLGAFRGDPAGLLQAAKLLSRANYRQTCVNLEDGILQEQWHLNNDYLRLCGLGLTGIARRSDLTEYDYQQIRREATFGSYGMADELGMPRPKNVTTIKPSGTLSKIMGTTEGIHKPLGRYIINNIAFSKHDPMVDACIASGYAHRENPLDPESILLSFPHEWKDVDFNGDIYNNETAITQLERYKKLMRYYCDQNVSCTVSYDPSESDRIVDWLSSVDNWDSYVGVSFLFRADPTKTAEDLGYPYLPQEVVTRETFEEYVKHISPIDLDSLNRATNSKFEIANEEECKGGVCPIK